DLARSATDGEGPARAVATDVLARVSPEQKLRLVELHQASGSVVAMIGDGVNDAPALRRADIGVAMGRRGTDVAREAAAMVLKDDDFATVVAAVEEGRAIFRNIRAAVAYLLSCNLSEILVIGLAAALGFPLPLLPLQILFLNLVTDVFPALALGTTPADPGVLDRPPRDPREPILARRHWWAVAGYALLLTGPVLGAYPAALGPLALGSGRAVTVAFLSLALAQVFHVLNMRDVRRRGAPGVRPSPDPLPRNPWVWAATLACCLMVAAVTYVRPLAAALSVEPLPAAGWALTVAASPLPLRGGRGGKAGGVGRVDGAPGTRAGPALGRAAGKPGLSGPDGKLAPPLELAPHRGDEPALGLVEVDPADRRAGRRHVSPAAELDADRLRRHAVARADADLPVGAALLEPGGDEPGA